MINFNNVYTLSLGKDIEIVVEKLKISNEDISIKEFRKDK